MIEIVGSEDAQDVFDLMRKVYQQHSFLEQGLSAYQDKIRKGEYVSLGIFENRTLLAHAGYHIVGSLALIGSLVVEPDVRSSGLGKSVFNARLEHITSNKNPIDFIVGYSMTQHLRSQKLYPDYFRPIGLDIGYPDIYHGQDSIYNVGEYSNGELILCHKLSNKNQEVQLSLLPGHQSVAKGILNSIGVSVQFEDQSHKQINENLSFMGFHPNLEGGIFVPGYSSNLSNIDFGKVLASNLERTAFVDTIRIQHAQNP